MRTKLALVRDMRTGAVRPVAYSIYESINTDAHLGSIGDVRVTDWTEVDLPERDADEVRVLSAEVRFNQLKKLRAERDAILAAELSPP